MSDKPLAVYTAIFGNYDGLIRQPKIPDVEYHCFTDRPIKAHGWRIHRIDPPYSDPTRSARRIKILVHEYLPQYDYSLWIDGNYCITGDILSLLNQQLSEHDMAVFDHNSTTIDNRDCVYEEYQAIFDMGQRTGKFKDDPEVMKKQIERYRLEGYPPHNGLIFSAVLLRRHHAPDVVKTMNRWWNEIENGSRRDQLSFNYSAWKENFTYSSIKVDLRDNEWFFMIGIHRPDYGAKMFRYRLRRMLGLTRHPKNRK
jgi:hypothetical protein